MSGSGNGGSGINSRALSKVRWTRCGNEMYIGSCIRGRNMMSLEELATFSQVRNLEAE